MVEEDVPAAPLPGLMRQKANFNLRESELADGGEDLV